MRYKSYSVLVFLVIFACIFSGCEEKRKALVTAHTAMGELLVSTKDQAKLLHTQKIIDDQTYQSIRMNWIRAQASYLTASDMLDHILSTNAQDITAYTERSAAATPAGPSCTTCASGWASRVVCATSAAD